MAAFEIRRSNNLPPTYIVLVDKREIYRGLTFQDALETVEKMHTGGYIGSENTLHLYRVRLP